MEDTEHIVCMLDEKSENNLEFFIQYFLNLGFSVEAFNISDTDLSNATKEMIKSTNRYTKVNGIPDKVCEYFHLDGIDYDATPETYKDIYLPNKHKATIDFMFLGYGHTHIRAYDDEFDIEAHVFLDEGILFGQVLVIELLTSHREKLMKKVNEPETHINDYLKPILIEHYNPKKILWENFNNINSFFVIDDKERYKELLLEKLKEYRSFNPTGVYYRDYKPEEWVEIDALIKERYS